MTFDLYCPEAVGIEPGAEVIFKKMEFPPFIIVSAPRDGGIFHITAYDRSKNLDAMLGKEYEQLDDKGEPIWYETPSVFTDIRGQCGLTHISYPGKVQETGRLCYQDINGQSCRSILEMISIPEGGFFYADSGGGLSFTTAFSGSFISVDDADCSAVKGVDEKRITNALGINELENEVYGWSDEHSVTVSGRLVSKAGWENAQSAVSGKTYRGWSCDAVRMAEPVQLGTAIGIGKVDYPLLNVTYRFGAGGIIASCGAPAPDHSKGDYVDAEARRSMKKVNEGSVYGSVTIDRALGVCAVSSPKPTTRSATIQSRADNRHYSIVKSVNVGGVVDSEAIIEGLPPKSVKRINGQKVEAIYETKDGMVREVWEADAPSDDERTNLIRTALEVIS